jgi:hypothetical protein
MRGDGLDVLGTGREPELVGMRETDPVKFAKMVLMSIGHGSTITSPFLHTTRGVQVARKWYCMGRDQRGDGNYLVRIRRTALPENCFVDMSTKHRQDSSSSRKRV